MGSIAAIGPYIVGAVALVFAAIVSATTYPILQGAGDQYYLHYIDSCEVTSAIRGAGGVVGERFVQAYVSGDQTPELSNLGTRLDATARAIPTEFSASSPTNMATFTASTCTLTWTAALKATVKTAYIVSEHGEVLYQIAKGATAAANSAVVLGQNKSPLPVLLEYATLSRLILAVLPVFSVLGFLALAAQTAWSYAQGGTGMIVMRVLMVVGSLIITIVGLFFAPELMSALNTAYSLDAGQLSIMGRFGTSLIPFSTPCSVSCERMG